MEITASAVKELRESTGAGMMDCKKALVESNGDMDKAIDYLREKGISKAAKKADRIAAEGLSGIYINNNKAVILEVNSETDFVAKNDQFKMLVDNIGKSVLESSSKTVEEALKIDYDGNTLNDLIVSETSTIGEKLSFRRFETIIKNDEEMFGSYLHMGGKISSLVLISGGNEEVAKDIAMQAAAMRPLFLNKESVPASDIEHEKKILTEQVIEEGKKPEFADKIVEGRLSKYFEEVCLTEQTFVKDSSMKVIDYLNQNNAKLIQMIRYEVGEGMEKRLDDFASEVMSQLNN